jgi:L-alanine-DL-glutamate epimerase-like enolase superfamily enzyme
MKLELRRVTALTPGARDARRSWPERQSLLLRLSDAQGASGSGEASPLPGYSSDALEDVEALLKTIEVSRIAAALEQPSVTHALSAVAALSPPELPSARMALETAALDFLSRRAGVPAPSLLGAEPHAVRDLAELIGPASSPELFGNAERALAAGFRHLKLKLGGAPQLEQELAAVVALRERLGPGIGLRLDANGSLTAPQLESAWKTLAMLSIELFEEPGAVPEALRGQLPLGLDESLQGRDVAVAAELLDQRQARFAVLKPMALGGLSHCLQLAKRAAGGGHDVVISHCFDGPWALRAAAALALALPSGVAHGLAPHAGLQGFPATPSPVQQGSLKAWSEPGLGLSSELGFE